MSTAQQQTDTPDIDADLTRLTHHPSSAVTRSGIGCNALLGSNPDEGEQHVQVR